MFKNHRLWILIIVLIHCSRQVNSEDDSDKTKRDVWSSGSFNSFSGDNKNDKSFGPMSPFAQVFSAIDSLGLKLNGNVKSTVEFWPPDMDKDKFYKLREEESALPLASWFNYKPLVKGTKEPEISYPIIFNDNKNSHDIAESTVKQSNDDNYSTKSLKDYTTNPDIIRSPQKYFKHEHYTVKPEIHDIEFDQKYYLSTAKPEVIDNEDKFIIKYYKSTIKRPEHGYEQNNYKSANPEVVYENSYVQSTSKPFISVDYENAEQSPAPLNDHSPTEETVNYDDALINVGPVMFPNIGLTEQRKHEFIAYVPTTATSTRANKKRKLKKKVKTSSITQFNKDIIQTPPTALVVNSSFDAIAETSSELTPVKEIINNDPINYTDIISNLSNLTELSFSSFNSTGNNHQFIQQSDLQKSSIKNIVFSGKVNDSTTPYRFIIKVVPEIIAETQDDIIDDKIKTLSSTTEIPVVTVSSSLPLNKEKLESTQDSSKAAEKNTKQNVNNDNVTSDFKIVVESSSPMNNISNSIDDLFFTTTVSTAKKHNRSRFGIRNFKPRVQSQAVRNQTSSTTSSVRDQTSSTASSVASTTVKSIPKKIKSSISPQVTTSSEKPINDSTMNVKTTARYYAPKSRTRNQNSRKKQSTTKSSSLATKLTTVRSKIRRTTKKSSKK